MERKRSIVTRFIAFVMVLLLPHCLLSQQWQVGQRAFFIPAGAPITWSFVQNVANFSCSAASTSCTVSGLTATTANSVLVTAAIITKSTQQHITSASGGGGTWTLCPGGCSTLNTSFSPAISIDQVFNITGTGGATSITATISALSTGAWTVEVGEWKRSTGTATFDTEDSGGGSSPSCTSCTAGGFSGLHGSSELLVQYTVYNGSNPTSVSSPYLLTTQNDFIYALNTAATAGPVLTFASATPFSSTGIAFY